MKTKIKNLSFYIIIRRLLLVLILVSSLLCASCSKNKEPETISGFYFDTFITITLYDDIPNDIKDGCFSLCQYYENLFSTELENSDIYKINHAKGNPVSVSNETMDLINIALNYAVQTNGKCDLTVYPVSSLWDFHSSANIIPNDKDIAEAQTHISFNNIISKNNTVQLTDPSSAIDLGFIAKGYIADKLKEYLITNGYNSGIINLGGNVLVIGDKPNHSPYNIGIEYPFHPDKAPIQTVEITNGSVVTSGIYERYFIENDILYHHILDVTTGYPINNEIYSVTIIGPSSTQCDALSTSLFALGLDDGLELINSISDYEAIFITSNYEIIYSDFASNYIK